MLGEDKVLGTQYFIIGVGIRKSIDSKFNSEGEENQFFFVSIFKLFSALYYFYYSRHYLDDKSDGEWEDCGSAMTGLVAENFVSVPISPQMVFLTQF